MSDRETKAGVTCEMTGFLVKWTANGPPEGWDGTPMPDHPDCLEIIELKGGDQPSELIYRRAENE